MNTDTCVRCKRDLEQGIAMEINGLAYCSDCAHEETDKVKEKKDEVQQEKEEIVKERDVIEKELSLVTNEDTAHIILTNTDTIQGREILEYIDIISVQDFKFHIVHFDPAVHVDSNNGLAEKSFRSRVELSLNKLKKRAYLTGADAVVGVAIDSSVDVQRESEYRSSVMVKANVSGTAVRLAEQTGVGTGHI